MFDILLIIVFLFSKWDKTCCICYRFEASLQFDSCTKLQLLFTVFNKINK